MDLNEIQKIIELMNEHGLLEVEIEDEQGRIRLKKEGETQKVKEIISIPQIGGVNNIASIPVDAGGAPAVEAEEAGDYICSPLVGTFYRRSSPDSEPFVKVGDHVELDTVVCIVEAMKVMNEVKAEKVGTIKKIKVEDTHPVEYMQPIFEIEID